MKKVLAIALALSTTMLLSLSAFAATSPTTGSVVATADGTQVVVTAQIKAEAASANLSTVEYLNNIVASVPGLETALPVAQAGTVTVNGVKTIGKINLTKPSAKEAKTVAALASNMGGKALVCVGVKPSFQFTTCQAQFAVAGLKAGANVAAFQLVNGQYVPVKINSVTDNFIDLTLENVGQLIIVELN